MLFRSFLTTSSMEENFSKLRTMFKDGGVKLKSKHKDPEGGLNRAGRKAYNKVTGGKLKRPVSKKQAKRSPASAKRRKSFCSRMKGMKKKLTSSKTANDPDSRINKALRKWDCSMSTVNTAASLAPVLKKSYADKFKKLRKRLTKKSKKEKR